MTGTAPTINLYPVRWVTLKRFCEITGETEDAVRGRRERGDWLDGKHYILQKRRLRINLPEYDRWVETAK